MRKQLVNKDKQDYIFHVFGGDFQIKRMLKENKIKVEDSPDQPFDVAVFSGGEDVSPFFYGEKKHKESRCNLLRDMKEVAFYKSLPKSMPKVGICRGAQFLNILSGGKMWQHVEGHKRSHKIKMTTDDRIFDAISTHHQMMIPSDDAWIIGVAREALFKESGTGTSVRYSVVGRDAEWDDPEIVYYFDTHSFCFQPHPEYSNNESREIFFELLDSLVFTSDPPNCFKCLQREKEEKK